MFTWNNHVCLFTTNMYVHDGYKYFFAPVEHFIISEAKSVQSAIGSNGHPVSPSALTSPSWQFRKLGLRSIRWFTQTYTADRWQSWSLNPDIWLLIQCGLHIKQPNKWYSGGCLVTPWGESGKYTLLVSLWLLARLQGQCVCACWPPESQHPTLWSKSASRWSPESFCQTFWEKLKKFRGWEKYYLRWNVSYPAALNKPEFERNANIYVYIKVLIESCCPSTEASGFYETLYIKNASWRLGGMVVEWANLSGNWVTSWPKEGLW